MQKIKTFFSKLKRCCPKISLVIFIVTLISIILRVAFKLSEEFSDFYNRYIGAFFRSLMSFFTNLIPFSLAETILMLTPLIVTVLIIIIIKASKKTLSDMVKVALSLFSALCFFISAFNLCLASGYSGSRLDKKLGIDRKPVTVEGLVATSNVILSELNALKNDVNFLFGSSSVMPYSFSDMNDLLQDAYEKASEKYDFLPLMRTKLKQIVLSEPMTYTHISGVYTYFTGESNINTNFPDYTLPFTAAHELAHQRGIAREDEANFVAFLVCLESEDVYIRYSGYMNLFEYLLSALYKASPEKYKELIAKVDNKLKYEIIAYNNFFEKYEDSVAADISGAINDKYLSSNGQTEGIRSYGMVVDLAVAYYRK